LKLTGSIESFREGSEQRRAFLSGLASTLDIVENQIIILSVRSGSIIVELAFLRHSDSAISPSEATSRLETAHVEGKLLKLGVTDLFVDGNTVNKPSSSSALSPLVLGIIAAGTVIFSVILYFAIKYFKRRFCEKTSQSEVLARESPSLCASPQPVFFVPQATVLELSPLDPSVQTVPLSSPAFGIECILSHLLRDELPAHVRSGSDYSLQDVQWQLYEVRYHDISAPGFVHQAFRYYRDIAHTTAMDNYALGNPRLHSHISASAVPPSFSPAIPNAIDPPL
jgi:hypothetical protein